MPNCYVCDTDNKNQMNQDDSYWIECGTCNTLGPSSTNPADALSAFDSVATSRGINDDVIAYFASL